MKALHNFWLKWFTGAAFADPQRCLAEQGTAESEIYMKRRNDALDVLAAHGLHAHYYLPATKIVDNTLADACRFLGNAGYIITNWQGDFVGKIVAARPSKGALTVARRPLFKIRSH